MTNDTFGRISGTSCLSRDTPIPHGRLFQECTKINRGSRDAKLYSERPNRAKPTPEAPSRPNLSQAEPSSRGSTPSHGSTLGSDWTAPSRGFSLHGRRLHLPRLSLHHTFLNSPHIHHLPPSIHHTHHSSCFPYTLQDTNPILILSQNIRQP
ncbi:hypothetical protein CRG98_013464 [Punica granatum]|uniref:Uncharacterized protein n=1 Tax=Punica granatum TaxID=22663 RepID=A0A2I0KC82_PUNGR|nr:hypothetical protein CRG98_013464 [Punica granatum]